MSNVEQVPVAEKTPRQKKRKASQEVAPLPDDEKRSAAIESARRLSESCKVSLSFHIFKGVNVPRVLKVLKSLESSCRA